MFLYIDILAADWGRNSFLTSVVSLVTYIIILYAFAGSSSFACFRRSMASS